MTKNGRPRDVPLSLCAIALLEALPRVDGDDRCFGVNSAQFDALFRKVRDRAGIKGLHFHDTRHEGITWLVASGNFTPPQVARIVGHSNRNMIMTYYNESAEDLALKMVD